MSYGFARPKFHSFRGGPLPAEHISFEDWQAEQARDMRTPGQRGVSIGSPVMWRHRSDGVIITERATVVAITDNSLTLLVKDVQPRSCDVHIREIVSSSTEHLLLSDTSRRASLTNRGPDSSAV